jgi:hypothetical protein
MSARIYRSLTGLKGASTSRVLNLQAISAQWAAEPAAANAQLFSSPALNSSIIVKHRIRPTEVDLMPRGRSVCTKIIVPFDKSDLRAGGRSFLIGQHYYEDALRDAGQYYGKYNIDRDMRVLKLVDEVPSLDPFLLREKLRSNGITPDPRYFAISQNDQKRMFDYTAGELDRLTDLAGGSENATGKMVSALLSNQVDEKLEPLRLTLSLGQAEFKEGVFSWRGFIYYKWCLSEVWPHLLACLAHLKSIQPVGPVDAEQKTYLKSVRLKILRGAKENNAAVRQLLQIYDDAYTSLISGRDPQQFRKFLLNAPGLFLEIGEKMGVLSHIASFWRFRFPDPERAAVDADELVTILHDFVKGMPTSVLELL